MGLTKLIALALFVLLAMLPSAHAQLPPAEEPPHLVFDVNSQQVFSSHNPFRRWPPASLTKLMTVYTTLQMLELQHLRDNSPVYISQNAVAEPPSKMGFPVGTVLTIDTAMKILMVKSANDVSVALAEAVGGDVERFVSLMNRHARRLGMEDSNFTNPHGLHDPDQYTSAHDMAVLTRALTMEFPDQAKLFNIAALRLGQRRLRNHNALLRLFAGTDGMKTGYVCASGFNVIVRTKRANRYLGAIIFGAKSSFARSVKTGELLTASFKSKGSQATLASLPGRLTTSNDAADITRKICPGKYPAEVKPQPRPAGAPTADDFDGIDTWVVAERQKALEEFAGTSLPVPQPRPDRKPVSTDVVKANVGTASQTVKEPPSLVEPATRRALNLRDKARRYLKAHKDLRPDERIRLGQAFGPNPFGLRVSNGSVYQPPIPLPTPRPRLDLAQSSK